MKKGLAWLAGIGLFLTGAAAGGVGMGAWFTLNGNPLMRMDRLGPSGFVVERMTTELGLSDAQRIRVASIVDAMMRAGHEARKPCMEAESALFEQGLGDIRAVLTPEQAGKYDMIVARMREMRPKGPPPFHGGPPPPPGPGGFFHPPPPPGDYGFGPPPPHPPEEGTKAGPN